MARKAYRMASRRPAGAAVPADDLPAVQSRAMTRRSLRPLAPLAALLAAVSPVLVAPVRATEATVLPSALEPAGTGGAEAVDRALAKLAGNRRLLVVAAHPDDEDTSLLALVSRQGGEAAYLSLSRGDGGQNLVGPELGVELGLLRTEELLAARRVDGARQYFTRALDFGYTRSLDETLARWPRETLAEDFARVVWRFRPQVVVSIFGNDGSGGHGQHRAAGWVAHETFGRLGDGGAFPTLVAEGLQPWQPAALYRAAWFQPELATATLSLAAVDPWSGRSVAQLAMESRSQHRSQDMGRLLELGPRDARLAWVAGGAGKGAKEPFEGIDTSLAGIVAGLPVADALAPRLAGVEARARAARERLRPAALGELAADFAAMVRDLGEAARLARGCDATGCATRRRDPRGEAGGRRGGTARRGGDRRRGLRRSRGAGTGRDGEGDAVALEHRRPSARGARRRPAFG